MTHSRPERHSGVFSRSNSAVGGSLPSLRGLLENGMGNGGRRWRMSAGFMVQAALLILLLLLPLLFTERLDSRVPADRVVVIFTPQRGERHGTLEAGEQRGPGSKGAGQVSRQTRLDFSGDVRLPVTSSDVAEPDLGPVLKAGVPGVPLGIPEGSRFGIPGWTPEGAYVRPPVPTRPVVMGGRIRAPRLLRQVQPEYPPIARNAGVEGDVVLGAVLGADGRVRELAVVSGHALLVQAARKAVARWVFEPTYLNDQPVPVRLQVVVRFVVDR